MTDDRPTYDALRALANAVSRDWWDRPQERVWNAGSRTVEYIAACSPDVVLGLLDEVARLREANTAIRTTRNEYGDALDAARAERDALAERIAEEQVRRATRERDAETRRADTAEESLVELAPSREATFGPDTITLAQVEYDDLLAERAGLSRHLEDSQAEVARLRSTQDPISVGIIEQATRELAERDAAIARMRAFDGEAT